jgi:hypothetical protein
MHNDTEGQQLEVTKETTVRLGVVLIEQNTKRPRRLLNNAVTL